MPVHWATWAVSYAALISSCFWDTLVCRVIMEQVELILAVSPVPKPISEQHTNGAIVLTWFHCVHVFSARALPQEQKSSMRHSPNLPQHKLHILCPMRQS